MNDSARTELKSREIAKLLEVVEETYLCQKGAPEYGGACKARSLAEL
jgi:hypothetical protein